MSLPRCRNRLSLEEMVDYWLDELPRDRQAAFEEHLLSCDVCSQALAEISELTEAICHLARSGALRGIVTRSFVKRVSDEGLRLREYRLAPGEQVACSVSYSDDLLVGRLRADLSESKRVDLVVCNARGEEVERWKDIPFHGAAGEVVFTERMETLRALPATTQRVKLVAVGDEGERLLGDYTFNHTPEP